MNDNNKNNTQRIDELLDYRIGDIKEDILETKSAVIRIEKMIVGNGSEGLIQKVSKNSANIKIILWALSIIVGGALTGGAVVNALCSDNDNKIEIIKNK